MDMWRSTPSAGVLVEHDGLVLVVARERSGIVRWELPSGKLQMGETFEEAAAREAQEETGLAVLVRELLCTALIDDCSDSTRAVLIYFRARACEPIGGLPLPTNEPIHEVRFLDLMGVAPQLIHPVDRRVLRMWRRKPDRPHFFIHIKL